MTGRVIIVTGANSGIGFETARYLCEGGNNVILGCRNEGRGMNAVQRIKDENPYALVTFMQLDLASKASIEKFVDRFHASGKKLHVLVCNAGIMGPKDQGRHSTEDRIELVMGTNYFGHFLLSQLLLEDLKKTGAATGDSRIVLVTSRIHDPERILKRRLAVEPLYLDNLLLHEERTYSSFQAYKNSKTALIMYGYHLSKILSGTGVTVNSVCPGFTPTSNLNREGSKPQKAVMKWFVHRALKFMHLSHTVHQAAQAVVNLADNEELKGVTGKYYMELKESQSSAESLDKDTQRQLYLTTGGMLALSDFEPVEIPQPPPKAIDQQTQISEQSSEVQTYPETPTPCLPPVEPEESEISEKKDATMQCLDESTLMDEIHDSMMVEPGDLSNLNMTLDDSKQVLEDSMLDTSQTLEP